MIPISSLVVMVALVIAYGYWEDRFSKDRRFRQLNLSLVFLPPLIGALGILVLWVAFAGSWPSALSLGWSIGWTIILAVTAVVVFFWDGLNYYLCEKDDEDDW